MYQQLKDAISSKFARTAAVVSATTLPVVVRAQTTGADYSAITNAVDWSTVTTGILTVLAAGAAVIVAFVGGKFLLKAIRGA